MFWSGELRPEWESRLASWLSWFSQELEEGGFEPGLQPAADLTGMLGPAPGLRWAGVLLGRGGMLI